jgi:hypothetical protein
MVHLLEDLNLPRSASLGDLSVADHLPQAINGHGSESAGRPSRGGHSRQHSLSDLDDIRLKIDDDINSSVGHQQKRVDEEDDHHRLLLPSAIQASLPRQLYSFRDDHDGISVRLLAKTKLQRSFVLANMMLPTLTMVICLFGIGSIWAAALSFHIISCILLPCAYMVSLAGTEGCAKVWASFIVHVRIQLVAGAVYFVAGESCMLRRDRSLQM